LKRHFIRERNSDFQRATEVYGGQRRQAKVTVALMNFFNCTVNGREDKNTKRLEGKVGWGR
jgi:hypothetical protein